MALSAATVVAPAAGEYDRAVYAELLPKVRSRGSRRDDGPGRTRRTAYLVTWPCFSHTWSRLTPQLVSVGEQVIESVLAPFLRST